MSAPEHSDALVLFGATGDLAHKKTFDTIQALIKRGHLDSPVIGVAKSGMTREQLLDQHRAMNEAVQARDPIAARAAVEAHLSYVEQAFVDQMRAEKHETIARQKLEQEASR